MIIKNVEKEEIVIYPLNFASALFDITDLH